MTRRAVPLDTGRVSRVLLPFAFAYSLSYFYRSVNAVIAPDLTNRFSLSPADLGLLTSAYFLVFSAFQLPLGLLLDRFGPRRTDATLLLAAAAGACVFALATDLITLALGRALIGLGVSGCLMSGIKANVLWFPARRLPALNGWMFFAGGVGMVAATWPVELALKVTSWNNLFLVLAGITVIASGAVFGIVPEESGHSRPAALRVQLDGLREIFGAQRFWHIALAAMTTQSYNMAVQSLWVGPWLRDVVGLSRDAVATHLLLMAVATMIGFLFWGNFAARIERRGVPAFTVMSVGVGAFLLLQLLLAVTGTDFPPLLWMGFGLFGTAGSLSYFILSQRFATELAGRVITALNVLVFAWAFAAQWAIGAIVGQWPVLDGHYDPRGYRVGFAVFLAIQCIGYAWMMAGARKVRK
jgi:MFS family permease